MSTNITDIAKGSHWSRESIEKARKLQGFMVFYSTISKRIESCDPYATEAKNTFFYEQRKKLPEDKAARFVQFFVNDVASILSESERVYKNVHFARDRYIKVAMNTTAQQEAFMEFMKTTVRITERYINEGTRALIRSVNDYLVVVPGETYHRVNVNDLLAVEEESDGTVVKISYQRDGFTWHIDNEKYEIYSHKDGSLVLVGEFAHELGYCPVTPFYFSRYEDEDIIKESVSTSIIDIIEVFLDNEQGRRYYEAYARYEILKIRASECNYREPNTGGECSGGTIFNRTKIYDDGATIDLPDAKCPKCLENRLIGPGTVIEVPQPSDPSIDNWEAIERVGADVPTLEYNASETQAMRMLISSNIAGFVSSVIGTQAINKDQVDTLMARTKSILRDIGSNLERSHKFLLDTYARLMYRDAFKGSIVNYGTDFIVKGSDQLLTEYKESKESGLAQYIIDDLSQQYDRKRYENNPTQLTRVRILRNLEPLMHLSTAEVIDSFNAGMISKQQALLSHNFSNYIERFETDHGDLVKYSSLSSEVNSFSTKINNIRNILIEYVNEDLNEQRSEEEIRQDESNGTTDSGDAS